MKTKRMNNRTNNCLHVGKGKSDISRQFDELKPFLRFLRTLHMNVETKKRIIPVMIAYFRPRFTSKFTSRPANTTPKKSSPKWHIKNGCYKGSIQSMLLFQEKERPQTASDQAIETPLLDQPSLWHSQTACQGIATQKGSSQ